MHTINARNAFTLAEILVTITIIGVIASLTIPQLITNIQKDQFRIAFKSIYSSLQSATSMIKEDNGGTLSGIFTDYDVARDKYLTYMPYVKKCDAGPADVSDCRLNSSYRTLLNGDPYVDNSSFSRTILANGALLEFHISSVDCTANPGFGGQFAAGIICGDITIDVNGPRLPNTYGKDVYMAWIVSTGTGLLPNGVPDDAYSHCTADSDGDGCAYKVLMNIDY